MRIAAIRALAAAVVVTAVLAVAPVQAQGSGLDATLTGTVLDSETGLPVPWLHVRALVGRTSVGVGGAMTDADGHWRIRHLPPGRYALEYTDRLAHGFPTTYSGGGSTLGDARLLRARPGSATTQDDVLVANPDPRLSPHTLSGVVTDDAGSPVRGVYVVVQDRLSMWGRGLLTDSRGRWAVLAPDGEYDITASGIGWPTSLPDWRTVYYPGQWTQAEQQSVSVTDGVGRDGLDLTTERAVRFELVPRDATTGRVLPTLSYRLYDADTGRLVEDLWTGAIARRYHLIQRPAGAFKLLAIGLRDDTARRSGFVPQWVGGGYSWRTAPTFTLAPGDVTDRLVVDLPRTLEALVVPRVRGRRRGGSTITAVHGRWSQMFDTGFSFEWRRDGTVLTGEQTYVVQPGDAGTTLHVTVTAFASGHETVTRLRVPIRP